MTIDKVREEMKTKIQAIVEDGCPFLEGEKIPKGYCGEIACEDCGVDQILSIKVGDKTIKELIEGYEKH